jgi:hypothetical protein
MRAFATSTLRYAVASLVPPLFASLSEQPERMIVSPSAEE